MKAFVDKYLNKFVSKKLTVFVIACIFVYLGKIAGTEWVNISMMYIGSQAAIDAIIALRNRG